MKQPLNLQLVFWTREEDALLGTQADKKLARKLGRSAKAVKARRQQLRICLYLKPWCPADEKILGTRPDNQIARLLGRSVMNVAHRRRLLGIKCFYLHRPWKQNELALLGVKTDQEISRLTGHPLKSVRAKRQKLGRLKPDGVMAYWSPVEDALFGSFSDAVIAKKTDRGIVAVGKRRR